MTPLDRATSMFCQHWFGSSHGSIRYCLEQAVKAYSTGWPSPEAVEAGVRAMFTGPAEGKNDDLIYCILKAGHDAHFGGGETCLPRGIAEISENLYQGSLPYVHQHWDVIKGRFDCVVLAAEGSIPPSDDHNVVVYPVPDTTAGLPPEQFWQLYAYVQAANTRLLCVCHVGENRSGLACVMALHQRGMPVEDAITLVRKNGNQFSTTQPHSFWNEGFAEQCRALLQ